MTFERRLREALMAELGDKVRFDRGAGHRSPYQWVGGAPKLSLVHHTAGAATTSTDPRDPGNQPGADAGIVAYVRHDGAGNLPFANATLSRDGTLHVHSLRPCWHAGTGTFAGTRWSRLGVVGHLSGSLLIANELWGVEVVSRGLRPDFTRAQKRTLARMHVALRVACGWNGFQYRIANHRDWAWPRGRKGMDTWYDWTVFANRARLRWLARPFLQ